MIYLTTRLMSPCPDGSTRRSASGWEAIGALRIRAMTLSRLTTRLIGAFTITSGANNGAAAITIPNAVQAMPEDSGMVPFRHQFMA